MSLPPVEASASTTLVPTRDGRLVSYGVIAFGGLGAALIGGEPALAALAVPFAVALALGLRRTAPVEVTARVILDSDQVLEGDAVTGRLELTWDGTFDAHLLLHRLQGVAAASDADVSRSSTAVTAVELPIHLEAAQWGRHRLGEVWLRLRIPFGLLTWTGKVMTGPPIRVLPGAERLTQLLSPSESRAVWGMHRTNRLGDGHEFAELRPYVPGNRLRDLNWAATARHRRPFVNRHHPELSGDVVIVLDAFEDASSASAEVLARAARVAWALTSLHLRANDRVGLVGLGGSTQWLPPARGRLAQYRLLEALLRIGGAAADRAMPSRRRPDVPPSALIMALTSLHDERSLGMLEGWQARGRSLAVVVIDATRALDPPGSEPERLAHRLWMVELARRRGELRRLGIPVVTAPMEGPITPAISALRRARRASLSRRIR